MDRKKYTTKLYKSYKQMEKSNDLRGYMAWEGYIRGELKLLTKDELVGLHAYYSDMVVMHEHRKTYSFVGPYIAMLSSVASMITGMIMYISNTRINWTSILATKAETLADWQVVLGEVKKNIDFAEKGSLFFIIFAFLILVYGTGLLIKENNGVIFSNKIYIFEFKMKELTVKEIEGRNDEDNIFGRMKQNRNSDESVYECSDEFKEKKKERYEQSLSTLLQWIKYYAGMFIVYCILEVMVDINYITVKELLVSIVFIFILLVIFEIGNLSIVVATEKKMFSKDDVHSQLRNIPIKQYREVLEGKEEDEIIEMYCDLWRSNRRNFNISMKKIYGAVAIALLPVACTMLMEYYKDNAITSSEVINIIIAFIILVPLLLDVVATIFGIIESDKIQRTSSVEKSIQDKIVKELAQEYLGIKKSN